MRSIDRLREYAANAPDASMSATAKAIVAGLADCIEQEVEELREREYRNGREAAECAVEFADRLKAAVDEREDVTLWGVDYTPLPLDAEGVPIHVGDWITGEWDAKAKVVAITSEDVYWWEPDGCHWCHAFEVRHHHAPTVEDVLLEACKAYHGLMTESMSDIAHDMPAPSEVIAEYAAKLRLAKGVDA